MSKPENPPAFPTKRNANDPRNDGFITEDGMSLRDYFAAKAMQSYLANVSMGAELQRIFDPERKVANAGDPEESPFDYIARLSLVMADAMLKARLAQ